MALRWYLRRNGLSYRDVEELLTERGIEVDHVTIYRWVQRFTPMLIDAARPDMVWVSSSRRPAVAAELDRLGLAWRWTGGEGPLLLGLGERPDPGSGQ